MSSRKPLDWILLRGLAREARHWGALPDLLEAAIPGARAITPDQPGCGTEARRSAPLSIVEMVEDLRARLLHGESLTPSIARTPEPTRAPFALLGLSLGGMVAMEWAARHPGEVSHVVLINTSAGDLSPPFRRLRPGALRILAGAALSRDLRTREQAGFRMTLNDLELVTPELLDEWTRIQESAPVRNATFVRQLVASIRFRAPKRLECPVLILTSRLDRMVDPRCSQALAARFTATRAPLDATLAPRGGATLDFHPTAGHDLPLEDPNWVAGRVAEWLSVLPKAPT